MPVIKQVFVAPTDFYSNTSASWFIGRKVSGMPAFEYAPAKAANTNMIVGFPIPWPVWDDGSGEPMELVQIKLHHFLSATSAGTTPLISANWQVYEAYHRTGGVITGGMAATSAGSVVCPQLTGATASAGFVDAAQASGQTATGALASAGVAQASLGSSFFETMTPTLYFAPFAGGQDRPYVPRLLDRTWFCEISASVGASAVWEIYGAFIQFRSV